MIYLASKSPRRKELLDELGIKFTVAPSSADESVDPGTEPDEAVKIISKRKCLWVYENKANKDDTVIAADTVVYACGEILGKPKDAADAERMLKMLSGKKHTVYTGLSVMKNGKLFNEAIGCDVYFRELSDEEIKEYIASGEPFDKAGAYGIQGKASVFIYRTDGDWYSVLGLPVCRLFEILKNTD